MKAAIKKLTTSEGIKSSAIVTFGNLGGTAISAIALILVSRFLGPSKFGIFSAAFSLLLILIKVGDLGANLATQRYLASRSKPKQDSMLQSIFILKICISLVILLLGLLSANFINQKLLHLNDPRLVILTFVAAVGVVFFEYISIIIQSLQKFSLFSLSVLIQALLKIAGVLALYFYSILNPINTIALYGASPFISGLIVSYSEKIPLKLSFRKNNFLKDISTILPSMKWTGIAIVAAALADNIDVLIVQNILTSVETGIFSAAVRITTFASLAGLSVGTVLNIRVAKYTTKKNLDKYLKKAKVLSILSFLAILMIIPFSKFLLLITAGSSYISGASTLSLLLVSTAFLTATTPFVSLFFLFKKPQFFAIAGILTTVILITADMYFIKSNGIIGAGIARIITRGAVLVFTLIYSKISYDQHFSTNRS